MGLSSKSSTLLQKLQDIKQEYERTGKLPSGFSISRPKALGISPNKYYETLSMTPQKLQDIKQEYERTHKLPNGMSLSQYQKLMRDQIELDAKSDDSFKEPGFFSKLFDQIKPKSSRDPLVSDLLSQLGPTPSDKQKKRLQS